MNSLTDVRPTNGKRVVNCVGMRCTSIPGRGLESESESAYVDFVLGGPFLESPGKFSGPKCQNFRS